MHWWWCTDGDALMVMHWCWCTGADVLVVVGVVDQDDDQDQLADLSGAFCFVENPRIFWDPRVFLISRGIVWEMGLWINQLIHSFHILSQEAWMYSHHYHHHHHHHHHHHLLPSSHELVISFTSCNSHIQKEAMQAKSFNKLMIVQMFMMTWLIYRNHHHQHH